MNGGEGLGTVCKGQSSMPGPQSPLDAAVINTESSCVPMASLVAQTVKNPPATWETGIRSLG